MPVLRITEKGFENYDGLLGEIHFKGGVSIENISRADARRLASIMGIVENETGRNPSETQEMVETRNMTVDEMAEYRSVDPQPPKDFQFSGQGEEIVATVLQAEKPTLNYNFMQEDLEKIADATGIEGLREFAAPYDVRGASIVAIIKTLMAVQKRKASEASAQNAQ